MPAHAPGLLVNIDVDDLGRGEAFYCGALGLRPGRRFGAEAVELLGATAPIYLLAKPDRSTIGPGGGARRDYRRHWTPVHLDFVVEDIDAASERLVAAAAIPEGEPRCHAWGRLAMFADPFGHGICLIQFEGRGYDEIADA